jgi:hypothetical protein
MGAMLVRSELYAISTVQKGWSRLISGNRLRISPLTLLSPRNATVEPAYRVHLSMVDGVL